MSQAESSGVLARHSLIYGGSLLLPRLAAFAALIIFSRLLSPAEYGYFALFLISAELIDSVFFDWIRIALLRLFPSSNRDGRLSSLRGTSLTMIGIAVLLSVPIAMLMAALVAGDRWAVFALLLATMNLANGLLRMRLAELQAQQRPTQFLLVGLLRAVLALALSLAFVLSLGPSFEVLAAGLVSANLILALACSGAYMSYFVRPRCDWTLAKSVIGYAGPIVPLNALLALVPLLQRYTIQLVAGPAAVGVFSAAQNLVQPPIAMLCAAVATASFPMVMESAESDGHSAAARRIREAGRYLVALGLPALAGLITLRSEIVTVILGEEFRAGAMAIVPWAAAAALASNWKSHYFDVAFHVTRRLGVQLITLIPVVLFMVPLIYVFLETWGLPGAAAAACVAYVLSMFASWVVGRRFLPIPHDFGEFGRVVLAVGLMVAVLLAIPSMEGVWGLAVQILAGCLAYAASAIALNILGVRTALAARLARRLDNVSI